MGQSVTKSPSKIELLFKELDKNGDGKIDSKELMTIFSSFGAHMSEKRCSDLIRRHKVVGSSEVSSWTKEEFVEAFGGALSLFTSLDIDGSGTVEEEEVAKALKLNRSLASSSSAASLIGKFDVNSDGRLDFGEFYVLYEMSRKVTLEALLDFWSVTSLGWQDSLILSLPSSTIASPSAQQRKKVFLLLAAGAAAGGLGRSVTAPVSRAIILSQLSHSPSVGALELLRQVVQKEGLVRGCWRGNAATVLKIAPSAAINQTLYSVLRDSYVQEGKTFGPFQQMLCGSFAGCVSLTATYPFDVVRTRMSASDAVSKKQNTAPPGLMDVTKQVLREKAMFRGLSLALAEAGPSMAIHYTLLETIKAKLSRDRGGQAPSMVGVLCASALSSAFASTLVYPLVVVRRNQQMGGAQKKAWEMAKQIFKVGGPKAFYRGLFISYAQIVPSMAVSFTTFEWAKRKING